MLGVIALLFMGMGAKSQTALVDDVMFKSTFDVVYQEEEWDWGSFQYVTVEKTYKMPYRIPAIVRTDGGKLIAFADKRYGGGDVGQSNSGVAENGAKNNNIDVVCRVSTDNGATWNDEMIVHDGNDSYAYGDAAVVADRENPQHIIMYTAAGNTFFTDSRRSGQLLQVEVHESTDGGVNWSDPDWHNMTDEMYGLSGLESYDALFFQAEEFVRVAR